MKPLALLLALALAPLLARSIPAQGSSRSLQDAAMESPARSYEQAMTEMLGVDEAQGTTNADGDLCVLFVVDISGSMNDIRRDGESRIGRIQRKLQETLKSTLLSGPRAYIGLMTVGATDPGYDYRRYLVPFTNQRSKSTVQDPIESLGELVPKADRGSSLRLAHYRGLQAIQAFCARTPNSQWRKYLVLLSDCYLDGPRPVGGRDFQAFDKLQDTGSNEYAEWLQYGEASGVRTLVVEPYNPDWRRGPARSKTKNVFPDDLAAVTPNVRSSDEPPALVAVVEGVCLKTPEGATSGMTGPDPDILANAATDRALAQADLSARVEGKDLPATVLGQATALNGRFFIVVNWPASDPGTERRVTLTAGAGGYKDAAAQTITVRPGDHAVYLVSLAPNTDWRIPIILSLGGLLLVWLVWPWELRINQQPKASTVHLFQPVRLFDRDTNRAVGTIYHFFINWLSVKGRATVRVNGSKAGSFRPIPGRCKVEIGEGSKIATFILDSGFMKPGGTPAAPAAATPRKPPAPRR